MQANEAIDHNCAKTYLSQDSIWEVSIVAVVGLAETRFSGDRAAVSHIAWMMRCSNGLVVIPVYESLKGMLVLVGVDCDRSLLMFFVPLYKLFYIYNIFVC